MPELVIKGCRIRYDEFGSGVPVVLTPGSRWGSYVHKVVATELAKDFRVITWDRPNTDGKSDFLFAGDGSEADMWADLLATMIQSLDLGPCFVGEYAGCRTVPVLCFKRPELVRGMMLAWPSGGEVIADRVPRNAYRVYIKAALRQGMQAVGEIAHFAKSIEQNPANRAALLALDRIQFARQMAYWGEYFYTSADLAVAGCPLTDQEWASIKVPTTVTGGCDPMHPTETAQRLHRLLPKSSYHEPVCTFEEWDKTFAKDPYPVTSDFQGKRIAPVWRDFIKEMIR